MDISSSCRFDQCVALSVGWNAKEAAAAVVEEELEEPEEEEEDEEDDKEEEEEAAADEDEEVCAPGRSAKGEGIIISMTSPRCPPPHMSTARHNMRARGCQLTAMRLTRCGCCKGVRCTTWSRNDKTDALFRDVGFSTLIAHAMVSLWWSRDM
jgi:hypothetical protein